jgi:cathepsin L
MTTGGGFRLDDFSFSSYIGCNALIGEIQKSPVSLLADASNWAFYKSGIFNNCGNNSNQAVLLVGVVDGNWKIKNSWGTTWG